MAPSSIHKIPTDERFPCHTQPCVRDGIHAISLRGASYAEHFCCEHMDDLMWALGQDQPDGETGFAKFRAEHFDSCGFVGKFR